MSASARFVVTALAFCLAACSHYEWQAQFTTPEGWDESLAEDGTFLKVHLTDGALYLFAEYQVHRESRSVSGRGRRYDADRTLLGQGDFTVSFDEIALLETNRPHSVVDAEPIVLGIVSAASLGMTAFCISDTKACFGSCPTFYADDGEELALQAEGFSASVARVYEESDVDALFTARPEAGVLELTMRNEAVETHAIRHVDVLAVPRGEGSRVLRSGDSFYEVRQPHAPTRCDVDGVGCVRELSLGDGVELAPVTDPDDLGARQSVVLEFPAMEGQVGLMLSGRNSLVGTFLFYQLLAWLGTHAGDFMMSVERGDALADRALRRGRELARVDVDILHADGTATAVGTYDEIGPIARDPQLLLLPAASGPTRIRLTWTRGFWKLDQASVFAVVGEREPVRIRPTSVETDGAEDPDALARLNDRDRYLVTLPGDERQLRYELPAGEHELFVESRGYYYEWIREHWLEEEDLDEVARFFLDFEGTLRRLAPVYKRMEPYVDRIFDESRVR